MKKIRITKLGRPSDSRSVPQKRSIYPILSNVAPSVYPAARHGTECITLTCHDGFRCNIGMEGTLLSGKSQACDKIYSCALANILSAAGSVIILTSSKGSSECRIANDMASRYGQPVRYIESNSATPGFFPFAGWNSQDVVNFFSRYIAPSYVGHNSAPSDRVRLCTQAFLELISSDDSFYYAMLDGITDLEDIFRLLETNVDDHSGERYSRLFRSSINDTLLSAQIIGDYMRAFQDCCTPSSNGNVYSLFSSGVTIIQMNESLLDTRATVIWYIIKMTEMLGRVINSSVTVIADELSEDALSKMSALFMHDNVTPILKYSSFGTISKTSVMSRLFSKIGQQYIFAQTDEVSASYWSSMLGEHKQLVRNYSRSDSSTRSFLQFTTRTHGTSSGYQEVYRPILEKSEINSLGQTEGYIYQNDGHQNPIHKFNI